MGDQTAAELRHALFLAEQAAELAHVGTWVTHLDENDRVVLSKECHRIFGLEVGTPFTVGEYFAMIHRDDLSRVQEVRRAALHDDSLYELEYRIVRRDGEIRWLRARGTVQRDAAGTPIQLMGVLQDITEHRKVIDDLRASEARYRRIIEIANEGVWTIDAESKTTFMNARMASLLGYQVDEVAGMPLFDFIDTGDMAVAQDEIEKRKRGIAGQVEKRLRRKDGSHVWVLLEPASILDSAGRYEGALAMVTDVTERKRSEQALRDSEAQLRQAQKLEAIGRLAGGVAHDFNNLLSVILSYSSMIIEDLKPGDPIRCDLEEVKAAGERATALTRQLLAFSRKQVLEPAIFDLNDTIRGMEKMLRRVLGEDVVLRLSLSSRSNVRADPGQIEQVIMNLVVNARDAMPSGGALVISTADVHAGSVRSVKLSVVDTGIGMNAETRERIFEPFFTTKSKDKGTGLGLSTVLGIVEQSGGRVSVSSEPEKGSAFDILLPAVEGAAHAEVTGNILQGGLRGSETILLVEDEEPVRVLTASILKRYGYHVLEATSVGEAVLLCELHPAKIDLLLTDVVMPLLSGPELAARILSERPDIGVLYMSGYPDETIAPHGILSPGIALLHKPVRPEMLLRKVREVLDSRS